MFSITQGYVNLFFYYLTFIFMRNEVKEYLFLKLDRYSLNVSCQE